MSIKITVRNYMFPLCFSHNGWNVRLEKRIGFFKDLTVEAYFTPPSMPNLTYWNEVLPKQVLSVLIQKGLYLGSVSYESQSTKVRGVDNLRVLESFAK